MRRESTCGGQYAVKDVSLLEKNGRIYYCLIEKDGKYREAPYLSIMENYITKNYKNIRKVRVFNLGEYNFYTKKQFQGLYSIANNNLFNKY